MRILTLKEWLEVIGCDSAYAKNMKATYEKTKVELQAQAELTQSETLKAVGEWLVWAKNPINVVPHGFTYIDGGVLNQAIKELSKGKPPEGMRSRYVRRSKRTSN